MLMMHINRMSLILLLSFLCFRQAIFVQPQLELDPNEVDVLRKIATTLGVTNPTNKDPCESHTISETASYTENHNITCNYRDGKFLHVTHLLLKSTSLQGSLPRELANLTFLEQIDLTRIYLSGGLPKEWASMQHLNRISINAAGISGKIPKEWGNFAKLTYLSLEANQLSGTIPVELGNLVNLTDLILSSNQFVGSLPKTLEKLTELKDFRISDNSFNGTVPEFIGSWTKLERLEMHSSGLEGPINSTIFALGNLNDLILRNLNMSGTIPKYIWEMGVQKTLSGRRPCPDGSRCQNYYQSFHINCGGPDVTIDHTKYEGDDGAENGAVLHYDRGTKWGLIGAGDFMDNGKNDHYIVEAADLQLESELYYKARASPLFLTYYGYCLENGDYTVNLHFAEILFNNDKKLYYRLGRRIFNIYIQEKLELKDFNIKEQANGTGKAIIKTFNATVTENTLEIRLYWAGKGTTLIPDRGIYGPLISAISVCRGFRANCDESKKSSNLPIVIGVVASVLCLIFSIAIFFCWRRYFGRKSIRGDLKGLDLQTGTFTFRQLKAATNNFSSTNKIGEGGFGSVYKAFNLQQKGNLMEIMDPMLEDKFDKVEAEKMIRVAILCSNADPALRPTMSEVVSMLESQTIVQEVASDPGIYGDDLQIKQLKGYYQQLHDQSSSGSSAPNFSSERTGHGSSTTSTHDLYTVNSESIYLINKSGQDLYSVNSESIYSNVTSVQDIDPVNSNSIHLT
ncbi:hypothetical protein EZV62_027018 [Acer yangbiense]|uniref:non-specific serine/threonine protein kinase n=1 Tax=Acer yangbiense TaxID=1000413 RepID=A0A5C7GSH6_9ROSI|nr:hypothetical protein EZV62_027018 [Acer yangbiense]